MARPTIYTPEERKERLREQQRAYRRRCGVPPRAKATVTSEEEKKAKNREYQRQYRIRCVREELEELEEFGLVYSDPEGYATKKRELKAKLKRLETGKKPELSEEAKKARQRGYRKAYRERALVKELDDLKDQGEVQLGKQEYQKRVDSLVSKLTKLREASA